MRDTKMHNADIGRNLLAARQKIQVADQLLTQTLPLSKEPKVLAVAFDHIHDAVDHAINALLEYNDIDYAKLESNFDFKVEEFTRLSKDLMLNKEMQDFIRGLYALRAKHKKSNVEFARKGSYVICSDSYQMDVLNEKMMEDYLKKAKQLVFELFLITKTV
jgi:hypothetical protein